MGMCLDDPRILIDDGTVLLSRETGCGGLWKGCGPNQPQLRHMCPLPIDAFDVVFLSGDGKDPVSLADDRAIDAFRVP